MAKLRRKKTNPFEEMRKALMTGISYIIPLVVAGGMILSLALIFGEARTEGTIAFMYRQFGGSILGLMVPILAAYIAYGLEGKPALIPGLAAGLAANNIGSGFIGGIFAGLIAGYAIRMLKKIPYNKSFAGTMTMFFYPLVGSLIAGTIMLFIIGKPIASVNIGLTNWLNSLQGANAIILGLIIGAMTCFDMGGPVNKAAYAFALAGIESGNGIPYAAFAAAKTMPGIALTISTMISSKYYDQDEIEAGKSSWVLGAAGITEGAIPFAISDPFRVIPAMMTGGAVASVLSITGGSSLLSAGGSLITIPVTSNPLNWVIALTAGTFVSVALLTILKGHKYRKKDNEEVENKEAEIA